MFGSFVTVTLGVRPGRKIPWVNRRAPRAPSAPPASPARSDSTIATASQPLAAVAARAALSLIVSPLDGRAPESLKMFPHDYRALFRGKEAAGQYSYTERFRPRDRLAAVPQPQRRRLSEVHDRDSEAAEGLVVEACVSSSSAIRACVRRVCAAAEAPYRQDSGAERRRLQRVGFGGVTGCRRLECLTLT